jgi:hypothetical protein
VEEPGAAMADGSQSPEAAAGPHDQAVMGSQTSEVPPDAKGRDLPRPTPLEIDAPDPLGGFGPSNVQCTTSVRSSTKPR